MNTFWRHYEGLMTTPPPDGSRDRRIEDPSNRYIVHPLAQALVPLAIRRGVSANTVSLIGLAFGVAAAICFVSWPDPRLALPGLALAVGWLIADGLDGKVARATGTASALGRFLDGVCDHLIFVLMYCGMAWTLGTAGGWALAVAAGAAHVLQATLYEGERHRFHRRLRGEALRLDTARSANPLVRGYDALAGSVDRLCRPFETALAAVTDRARFGEEYAREAWRPMRLLALLSANVRVLVIAIACFVGSPALFWWFELVPLTIVLAAGMIWHRRVEQQFTARSAPSASDRTPSNRIGISPR